MSATGKVTGVAVGEATIMAESSRMPGASGTTSGSDPMIRATATVTVIPVPVASITVSPNAAQAVVGTTVQLTATPRDSAGGALSDRSVTWASSNTQLATVNADGAVSALRVDTATITATSEGKQGTSSITVLPVPVVTVDVTPDAASVLAGDTVRLTATPRDSAGTRSWTLGPSCSGLIRRQTTS